jgi:hypothetical protein
VEYGDAGFDVDGGLVVVDGELVVEAVGEDVVAVLVDLFGGGELADEVALGLLYELLVLAFPF